MTKYEYYKGKIKNICNTKDEDVAIVNDEPVPCSTTICKKCLRREHCSEIKLIEWCMEEYVETLKPCPFCGGTAVKSMTQNGEYYIFCVTCDAKTNKYLKEKDAVKIWNRRA